MNRNIWEDLISSTTFTTLPEINQRIILEQIASLVSFETIVSQAEGPEVVSLEVSPPVPTTPRSLRLKKSTTKEKQKKHILVRHSLRKTPEVL